MFKYIFSSCTIGIVTATTTTFGPDESTGNGAAAAAELLHRGLVPLTVSLACFYHSSVLFACVCVWCRRHRRRSQWKRLARRRPLVWPCKVSGARLMKTLYLVKRFAWDSTSPARDFVRLRFFFFPRPFISSTYRNSVRYTYARARVVPIREQ